MAFIDPGLVPIEQLYPVLRTVKSGDLILFTADRLTSKLIQWSQENKWHHLGILCRYPDGRVSIFHSVSEGIDLDGNVCDGVIEADVQQLLEAGRYTGFAVRRLSQKLSRREHRVLIDCMDEFIGIPYEKSLWNLIRASSDAYDDTSDYGESKEVGFLRNSHDLSSIFCSELISEVFSRMGRITTGPETSEYTPADFTHEEEYRHVRGIWNTQDEFDLVF